jgi:CubicO group peptidase (beta-lactamase class C family)
VSVDEARRIVETARNAGVFPAGAAEVGSSAGPIWTEAFGIDSDTPFDLASLTKVIATTTIIMELVRTGTLHLEDRVSEFFDEWSGTDREAVTVRDLLEHAGGLSARLLDIPPHGRREFEHDISVMPLEYAPRTRSIYSDLGFILLGFLAEDRGGSSLAEQFSKAVAWIDPESLTFELPAESRLRAAPTRPLDDDRRRGRVLAGEVHDPYAAALGGGAGHAGLFGDVSAVGVFARAVLRAARGIGDHFPGPLSPAAVRVFTRKSAVHGSSRALGWDTMLPTSSCGTRMSIDAFGHVGYTGTSLWIDPARDRYFVLLTNRVFGHGTLEEIRIVRRAFHDALADT